MKKQWYLGLDYGKSWIGLAVGNSELGVSSVAAIKYVNESKFISDINKVVTEYAIDEIVMGIPDGLLNLEVKELGEKLEKSLEIKVNFQNEFDSSKQVVRTAKASGIRIGKLKIGEHSLAASEILRSYLFEKVEN